MKLPRTNRLHRVTDVFALLLLTGMLALPLHLSFAAEDAIPPAEVTAETFPGLQDVVPMSSQLADDLTRTFSEINTNIDIGELTSKTEKLEQDWIDFSDQVESYGEFGTWPANRLLQAQTQIEQHNQNFSDMLAQVGEPLSSFEDLRVIWSERKQFWIEWKKSLKEAGANVPRASFSQVDNLIIAMLSESDITATKLVKLQQRISKGREGLLTLRKQFDDELSNLRLDPFKRNAHPLMSQDFFQQFDGTLWKKAREGLKATFQFQSDFLGRQGWLLGLQSGLVFLLFWIFRLLERATADRAEEWRFVFQRPVAAALFISTTIPQLFYLSPPPLLLLMMTALAIFSAARLATALITDKNERSYVYILAFIYIFTGALNVTGIPLPYQRLYLFLLSLIGLSIIPITSLTA